MTPLQNCRKKLLVNQLDYSEQKLTPRKSDISVEDFGVCWLPLSRRSVRDLNPDLLNPFRHAPTRSQTCPNSRIPAISASQSANDSVRLIRKACDNSSAVTSVATIARSKQNFPTADRDTFRHQTQIHQQRQGSHQKEMPDLVPLGDPPQESEVGDPVRPIGDNDHPDDQAAHPDRKQTEYDSKTLIRTDVGWRDVGHWAFS